MATNKGKPSGTYAENKKSTGKKADYKRSGWPEDASTQYVEDARGRQTGKGSAAEELRWADTAQGRDREVPELKAHPSSVAVPQSSNLSGHLLRRVEGSKFNFSSGKYLL